MGGDNAPEEIVAGALLAHRDGLGRIVLVGDRARIEPLLARRERRLEIVHAAGEVAMDAPAAQAVRNVGTARRSATRSTWCATGAPTPSSRPATAARSSAIALVRLRTIPGIARPAIGAVLPGKRRPGRAAAMRARTSTAGPNGWCSSA